MCVWGGGWGGGKGCESQLNITFKIAGRGRVGVKIFEGGKRGNHLEGVGVNHPPPPPPKKNRRTRGIGRPKRHKFILENKSPAQKSQSCDWVSVETVTGWAYVCI